MQVEPNSTIELYKNIPLNVGYEHTIFFPSEAAQSTYFNGMAHQTFQKQSYQRVSKGVIRLAARYTNVYGVNYMRFKNAGIRPQSEGSPFNPYLDKWFYAFVLNAEYINEEVCELTYTLDVMQTWFFDAKLKPCYVEREHTDNDAIGANLLPEPVHTGEYQFTEVGTSNSTTSPWFLFYKDMRIYVLTSSEIDPQTGTGSTVAGQMINGVYSGLKIKVFTVDNTGITDLNNYLVAMADALISDRIVAVYTAPNKFGTGSSTPTPTSLEVPRPHMVSGQVVDGWTYTETISTGTGTITTTRPHNNKLYTSPFTLLHATAPDGSVQDYLYEYFTSTNAFFQASGVASGQPEMQLVPQYYKNVVNNLNERMVYNGWPMNAWGVDAYRAWLAQNQGRMNIQAVSGAFNVVGDVASAVVGLYRNGSANLDSQAATAEGTAVTTMQKRRRHLLKKNGL